MIRSTLELLPAEQQWRHSSAFTGWDIILDKLMNPWIMEVNKQPDMLTSVSSISQRNPQVINTALELVMLGTMNKKLPKSFYAWEQV